MATERALIGLSLYNPTGAETAFGAVAPADLYQPQHQAVWASILALRAAAQPIDALTVAARMRVAGDHRGVETDVLLAELVAAGGVSSHADRYALTITEMATRRASVLFAEDLRRRAWGYEGDTGENPRPAG